MGAKRSASSSVPAGAGPARSDDAGDGWLRGARADAARGRLARHPVIIVTAKDLTREEVDRLNGQVVKVLQKGTYRRGTCSTTSGPSWQVV